MVLGLFEIQLVTIDHESMVDFYTNTLGLEVTVQHDERGRLHLGLGTGQLILARANAEQVLADWPGVPPRLYEPDDTTTDGPAPHGTLHYAFHVDDGQWHALVGRLDKCDPGVCRGPITWGASFESIYFRDPDGNVAELIRGV